MAKAGLGVAVLVALGVAVAMAIAARAAHSGGDVARLPLAAASILAWGGGVLVAFTASSQALVRDEREGIRALVASRGATGVAYAFGRATGLAAVLAALTCGGVLLSGGVLAATVRSDVAVIARGTLAAAVGAVAFSVTMAPLSLAALGARSRAGGYLVLVGVVAGPELVARLFARALPDEWGELLPVPAVVSAVADAIAPGTFDPMRGLRAAFVLALIAAASMAAVRRQLARARELAA